LNNKLPAYLIVTDGSNNGKEIKLAENLLELKTHTDEFSNSKMCLKLIHPELNYALRPMPEPDIFPVPSSAIYAPQFAKLDLPSAYIVEVEVPGIKSCYTGSSFKNGDDIKECDITITENSGTISVEGFKPLSDYQLSHLPQLSYGQWKIQYSIPPALLLKLEWKDKKMWAENGILTMYIPKNLDSKEKLSKPFLYNIITERNEYSKCINESYFCYCKHKEDL